MEYYQVTSEKDEILDIWREDSYGDEYRHGEVLLKNGWFVRGYKTSLSRVMVKMDATGHLYVPITLLKRIGENEMGLKPEIIGLEW